MPEMKCVTVLDLGTTSFKCGNVTSDGRVTHTDTEEFDVSHDGSRFEVDFEASFEKSLNLLQKAVSAAKADNCNIEAILITSQAQTFAPVDGDLNPLSNGLVWLDARAGEEAKELDRKLQGFAEKAGFARVLPELYISKLLWIKRNSPEVFKQASHYPLINEYIAFKLTGHFYSDTTNFGMSGVLNIRTGELNRQVLEVLELSHENFPEIHQAATLSYPASSDIKSRIGLAPDVNVYLCGNDQSASSAGAGLESKGDVSANFGTAMVAYALTEKPVVPDEVTQIAGINPMGGYFLLSVENHVGDVIGKAKEHLFPDISYDDFFSKYEEGISEQFDTFIEHGEIDYSVFPSDEIAAAAVTDHFVRRFVYHMSVIKRAVVPKHVFASGGLTQSKVWTDIVRKKCDYEVTRVNAREAGLIGAYKIYSHNN